jgi:hypothetical protein
MWVPAGLVYLGTALAVLGAWLAAIERREARPPLSATREPAPPRVP